jgi:hypothetical protein
MEYHLADARLLAFVLDDMRLDEAEYAHLLQCGQCIAAMFDILQGSFHQNDPDE